MSDICKEIHFFFNNLERLKFPFDENKIPLNGVYILFEKGEFSHKKDRIVRVGTHTGKNQLLSRLKQHFLNENKDRSIFRKNVGRAILMKNKDPFIECWELDLTTKQAKDKFSSKVDFLKQKQVEKQVSEYIRENFSFVVLKVDDKENRLKLESKIISALSGCDECMPSVKWLGNYSPKEKIKSNGLWLVNELFKIPLTLKELKEIESGL